ncbi:MAG: type II toxin-antitoxin system VapC family toxin [Treponema sp.]|jgi:predicted nucleic acid-binding protein|nr:type II toxin-antitoxin system VapC family toxin [Treponema sp.]
MVYVYDASFIWALVIPDERNLKVEKIHASIDEDEKIFTPQLFWYEMTNIFNNLLLRRRYSFEKILPFFSTVSKVGLTTDFETGIGYTQKLFRLCNDYQLSSYDAAYLELADRKKAVLCTLDRNLKIAARKHGTEVINAL